MGSDIERAAFSRGVRSRDAEIARLKTDLAHAQRVVMTERDARKVLLTERRDLMLNAPKVLTARIAVLETEVEQLRRWGKESCVEIDAIREERDDLMARANAAENREAALRAALAAGPAALRSQRQLQNREFAARVVVAAQEAEMKEGT